MAYEDLGHDKPTNDFLQAIDQQSTCSIKSGRSVRDAGAIETALQDGANPNVIVSEDDLVNNAAIRPVQWAILHDRFDVFELLMDYGADIFSPHSTHDEFGKRPVIEFILDPQYCLGGKSTKPYLDAVLARMNVGMADQTKASTLVESIRTNFESFGNASTGYERELAAQHFRASFRQLLEMGVTFGGSKKVAVGSEVAAPAPQVSAIGAQVQSANKGQGQSPAG